MPPPPAWQIAVTIGLLMISTWLAIRLAAWAVAGVCLLLVVFRSRDIPS